MSAHDPTALTVALSLVSHTNVGKTTLARSLLRRDIGEVRDEAHVTQSAEQHTLVESPAGDRLLLWDTPGFGDSARLAKRLAQAGNPIGWFLSEVWDRFRDRAFWSSQRAVRNVLEQADAVLYLVNASESPQDAGYLDAELQVLELIGKPVLVLLNQLGRPQPPQDEAAELQRWRERLRPFACVREVLALDAFARCWVQEGRLLQAVGAALPAARRPA
jgi:predicted GTPase